MSGNPKPTFKMIGFEVRNGVLQGMDEMSNVWINVTDLAPVGSTSAMVRTAQVPELIKMHNEGVVIETLFQRGNDGNKEATEFVTQHFGNDNDQGSHTGTGITGNVVSPTPVVHDHPRPVDRTGSQSKKIKQSLKLGASVQSPWPPSQ